MMYTNTEMLSNKGWCFLSKKMSNDRADKIKQYAEHFLEPALIQFPELYGKVYLLLRKNGWLAEYKPVLHIVIREEALEHSSEWRIRSTTAHELLHLVQFINGFGLDNCGNNMQIEKQATFLTFSRGFAFDYLKTFPADCDKHTCDHKFKFSYFSCDKIFKNCCKLYTEKELMSLANKLKVLSQNYTLNDNPNYNKILYDCLFLN